MDRPIIFSSPMVRALLDGRKTQTRRALNPQPETLPNGFAGSRLPYAFGDRLWVREAIDKVSEPGDVFYRADYEAAHGNSGQGLGWKSSIHMPRWASRITLTVTEVRVQRLQEISEADAVAEGIFHRPSDFYPQGVWTHGGDEGWHTPEAAYRHLWNSLHGPDAWDENPWVVAITFTTERRNIDAI